ncbi:hypothetical protein [Microbacterium testaceum]|uniref:hypothetical protein n=1 Tax=Microbacterium testaceum TaxID=2033 RepID=UPI0012465AED|nr:hypothetical protein [Microbacterium testaceum]
MGPSRVHILGASGSGTTTLGHALAARWAVPHADADDYFWMPTTPPFSRKRDETRRVALMREIFAARPAWVLSGSMLGWGESIVAECDAIVFLALDPSERLRRLEARETIRRGGLSPDDEAWRAFRTWAEGYDDPAFDGRNRAEHDRWLATIGKPVLRLDSRSAVSEMVDDVCSWEPAATPS